MEDAAVFSFGQESDEQMNYNVMLILYDVNGQPNLNDVWIVNGAIFETTYDMRSFRKGLK